MKKRGKIALLVIAVVTIVIIGVAVIMLRAVSGDTLFYMDSRRGHFYALTYRWFSLAGLGFVLFWVLLVVAKRKAIAGGFARLKPKTKPKTTAAADRKASGREASGSEKRFCASCGKPIPVNSKFCAFCGTPKDTSPAEPGH